MKKLRELIATDPIGIPALGTGLLFITASVIIFIVMVL